MEARMAIADILLCIDPTTVDEGRLKLAINLAQAHKAHLNTCYIMPEERGALIGTGIAGAPVIPAAGMVGIARILSPGVDPDAAVVPQVAAEAERADTVEQYFRAELRLHGLGGEWHLFSPGETGAFIELAKTVDLIILGQPSPDFRSTGFRPEDIVVAAARPILVIPYTGTFETAGRRALVAWDGTREAVRAVNDALPLLGDAEVVIVTFVGAQETSLEQHRPSLERIVDHLLRHGIPAKPEETLHGGIAISDILLSRAADLAADLIVCGAYHHSQLREALIGGVSRELLRHMTVPVLMSH
jgi:nucleotide-binding universal stress UspA family protein